MTAQTEDIPGAAGAPVERPIRPVADARRYGRFTMPAQWAREFRTELKRVMGLCVVFKAEHLFDSDSIDYWAACEHFGPVAPGNVVPVYQWHFTDEGDVWCELLTGLTAPSCRARWC